MPGHAGANSILSVAIAPALVDQSAANTLSAVFDMQGYDRIRFIYQIGAMASGAILSSFAVESNESNLGNATNITHANNASNQARLVNVANTENNSAHVLDIYRPGKRYVGVYIDAVTANITMMGVLAERFRGTGTHPITPATNNQYVVVAAN